MRRRISLTRRICIFLHKLHFDGFVQVGLPDIRASTNLMSGLGVYQDLSNASGVSDSGEVLGESGAPDLVSLLSVISLRHHDELVT